MDDIEINIQVTIPDWLRRKMGLTDETVPDSDKNAFEEEQQRLEDAIRRANTSYYVSDVCRNEHRSEDRG